MGSEMAYNLFSKQFAQTPDSRFVVCDAIPEAATSFCQNFKKQFPGANLTMVHRPQEATQASERIITVLPSSPHVSSVYRQGIIPALRELPRGEAERTLCIDSTTLDVNVARDIAKEVVQSLAQMLDAPMSGGVTGAKAGTLTFLVGGPEASFKLSQSLLSMMGQRIIHCGDSGSGLAAKICNNLVLGVQQIVVAEAMLLGQRLGLDPAVLASVISSSTGSCWSISVNNPVPHALPEKSPPCERDYDGGFATSLMLKDMGLAADVAAGSGSPLPLGEAATRIYEQVIKEQPKLAHKDFSSVYRFLEGATRPAKGV